tara:strand:- start:2117 stop:2578 length:462 start_codon:yes stop_codon:yes gene_type:complete
MSFKTWATTKEIKDKWDHTGLLESAIDKTATAMLLEGQRIYNEKGANNTSAQFKRVSIPLAVRVGTGMTETALLGSALELPNWYTFKDIKLVFEQDSIDEHDLDAEAKVVAEVAGKLSEAVSGLAKSKGSNYVAVHCLSINPDNTIKVNYSVD